MSAWRFERFLIEVVIGTTEDLILLSCEHCADWSAEWISSAPAPELIGRMEEHLFACPWLPTSI